MEQVTTTAIELYWNLSMHWEGGNDYLFIRSRMDRVDSHVVRLDTPLTPFPRRLSFADRTRTMGFRNSFKRRSEHDEHDVGNQVLRADDDP